MGPTVKLVLSINTRSAWPRFPVRTFSFAWSSLPGERVCEFAPTTGFCIGFYRRGHADVEDPALEAVDCIANKTMNSNAGVHLRLYMAHPCKPLGSSFQFRFEPP